MPRATALARLYVPPMPIVHVTTIPRGEWRLERRFSGRRAIATIAAGRVELWSSEQVALAAHYPALAGSLRQLPCRSAVLDGEIVTVEHPDHPSAPIRGGLARSPARPPVMYHVFDLLRIGGQSLLEQPLEKRQTILQKLLDARPPHVRVAQVFDVTPERLLPAAHASRWEGIIAKARGSRYAIGHGRGTWLACALPREPSSVAIGSARATAAPTRASHGPSCQLPQAPSGHHRMPAATCTATLIS